MEIAVFFAAVGLAIIIWEQRAIATRRHDDILKEIAGLRRLVEYQSENITYSLTQLHRLLPDEGLRHLSIYSYERNAALECSSLLPEDMNKIKAEWPGLFPDDALEEE